MAASLAGRTAIVTGAGHGVGVAMARRFAAAGAKVVASDRDGAEATVERIRDDGGEAVAYACDLAEPLSVSNLIAATLNAYGRVDVLANAARKVAYGDALKSDSRLLTDLFDFNVRATLTLAQAAATRMIEQAAAATEPGPAGAIVNVSSIAAQRTLPELLHYSVSCAALDQMTRSLALSLSQHRIRVNAVALGSVMTASLRDALKARDGLREALAKVTPLGRIGEADEAAEAALFLASDAASFITGQVVAVDGGRTVLDPLDTPTL